MIGSNEKLFGQKLRKSDPFAVSFLAKMAPRFLSVAGFLRITAKDCMWTYSFTRSRSPFF